MSHRLCRHGRFWALLSLVVAALACAAPPGPAPTSGGGPAASSEAPAAPDPAPSPQALERFTVTGSSQTELSNFAWSLAVDLGYFRDEGLDPQFVALPSAQMVAALLQRDAQY